MGVLVVDDHPVFVEGVARAITDHSQLDLLATASDGREGLDLIRARDPDVALVELRLPGLSGCELLDAVTQLDLGTRVLMISSHVEDETVHEALARRAAGFITKSCNRDEICLAILAVRRGEIVVSPSLRGGVLAQIAHRRAPELPRLSEREVEILELLAKSTPRAQIARQLYLSEHTVKTYMARIYKKFDVPDRTAAVLEAMRRGIIS